MKRRLTKLVVFLLLGAIVNVAVAWGCALVLAELSQSTGGWPDRRTGSSYRGSNYRYPLWSSLCFFIIGTPMGLDLRFS